MKILVVDDNISVQNEILSWLSKLGFNVDTANNGLDGYEKLQSQRYDLALIDHLMPLMNGIQLIKNVRQLNEMANLPIIFMTTQGRESIQDLHIQQQADEIISKPLDESFLLSLIDKYNNKNTRQQTL